MYKIFGRFSAIILFILLYATAYSQDVYWEPENPVQGGTVKIFYNLENRNVLPENTSPVYLHLGFDDWNNTDDYTMTKNINDYWEYQLSIPQNISTIDFAFTDNVADYNAGNWDNNGGYDNDWHIDVYPEGLSVVVVSPLVENPFNNIFRTPMIIPENEILPIIITTVSTDSQVDSILLNINNEFNSYRDEIYETIADTLIYNFDSSIIKMGRYKLQAVGIDVNGFRDTTQFGIVVRPEPLELALPTGLVPGVNKGEFNYRTLVLFAPEKEYVYYLGDSENWEVQNYFLMNKHQVSQDSILWWKETNSIQSLDRYQYLVDGEIRIADPYTEQVLDPWNDQYIAFNIYPDMAEYPYGKTREMVGTIGTQGHVFSGWQYSDDFEKPEQKDLIIYELLIRDFLEQHDYNTLIDTLDYLENLGINAIELMPINEFEGNSSWGYNPSFYFAPDKYYGEKAHLKMFIDECHRRGIAVIQDIVLNHSYGQSPLVRLYWDDENNRPAANNPWYNKKSPNPVFSWGYDFNHESEHTQYFIDRILRFWIEEYKIDGYRLDFTKGFTNTGGDGSYYDAARIAILNRIANEVWSYAPSTYLILEHFGDNAEEKELANHGFMLWGKANYEYNQASMGYSSGSDFSWGYYKNRSWEKPNLVTYMESHDEERLMYKNINFGNSSGDYNIKNLPTALERQKLVAAFFFTLPGPKMIWQFGELGYDFSINYNGRVGEKPIRWDYFNDSTRIELYDTYSKIINLRKKNEVFTNPLSVDLSLDNPNGLKRIGLSGSTNVIIVGNFGVVPQSINPVFPYSNAWWYYNFNADSVYVADNNELIELQPGEYRIYTSKHLLDVEDMDEIQDKPLEFTLSQNYPNPFNPVTTIKYTVSAVETNYSQPTQLKVYNILGNEIAALVNEIKPSGEYEIKFDGSSFSNGIYFYTLLYGDKSLTKKMLLLK